MYVAPRGQPSVILFVEAIDVPSPLSARYLLQMALDGFSSRSRRGMSSTTCDSTLGNILL